MSFPSKIQVASALIYVSPRPDLSMVEKQARDFVLRIKRDAPAMDGVAESAIGFAVRRLREQDGPPWEFLRNGGLLIPVPGHGVRRGGTLWVPQRICEELQKVGIGDGTTECIERLSSIAKSAYAPPGCRPDAESHYRSMRYAAPGLLRAKRVTLVDDVVTTGATIMACARHLVEAMPRIEVGCFAIARVDRDVRLKQTKDMFAPKIETVDWVQGSPMRA